MQQAPRHHSPPSSSAGWRHHCLQLSSTHLRIPTSFTPFHGEATVYSLCITQIWPPLVHELNRRCTHVEVPYSAQMLGCMPAVSSQKSVSWVRCSCCAKASHWVSPQALYRSSRPEMR